MFGFFLSFFFFLESSTLLHRVVVHSCRTIKIARRSHGGKVWPAYTIF